MGGLFLLPESDGHSPESSAGASAAAMRELPCYGSNGLPGYLKAESTYLLLAAIVVDER